MKITTRQFGRSLYESLKGKTAAEAKTVLKRFVVLLGERRELGRAEDIVAAFQETWEKEEGELTAELVTARKLPAAGRAVSEYLKERTGVKTVNLEEHVDSELVGGFVLRYRDRVLDASLRTGLENLQNKLGS